MQLTLQTTAVLTALYAAADSYSDSIDSLPVLMHVCRQLAVTTGEDALFELAEAISERIDTLEESGIFEDDTALPDEGTFEALRKIALRQVREFDEEIRREAVTQFDDEYEDDADYEPSIVFFFNDGSGPMTDKEFDEFRNDIDGLLDPTSLYDDCDCELIEHGNNHYTMRVSEDYPFVVDTIDHQKKNGKIVPRYILTEQYLGNLICDNNGKGYKSVKKALKAMWNMFGVDA